MRRLTLCITPICLLFASCLHAQDIASAYQEAKIDMIREAVIFYSTDEKISERKVDCNATDVAGLKACAKSMKNVDKKIDDWSKRVVNDDAGLRILGKRILKDITDGKKYREKLETYAAFKKKLENPETVKIDPVSSETNVAVPDLVAPVEPAPAPQSAAPAPDESSDTASPNKEGPVAELESSGKGPLAVSLAALVVAIAALILALMKRRRRSQRRSRSRPGMQQGGGESETYNAESAILPLQRKVAELDSELENVNKMIEESERRVMRRIESLESQQTTEWPTRDQSINAAAGFPATKKWAKSVDSGGFSIDALAADPDDKMIYEITQTGRDTATFRISDAREAQLFALSNPQNYLREGCTYTTQPSLNSQIRTEVPGSLELQGRKWRIIRQAQIAFV